MIKPAKESGIYAWKRFVRNHLEPRLRSLRTQSLDKKAEKAMELDEEFICWFLKCMRLWMEMNPKDLDELRSLGFSITRERTGEWVWDLADSSEEALEFASVIRSTKKNELSGSLMIIRSENSEADEWRK